MPRIIAGEYKGRKLQAPIDDRIRPTADRVKESLFNILQNFIPGKRVLDLFAGTGNLGLEALSRGASYVVFVDNDTNNEKFIQANIEKVNVSDKTKLFIMDYEQAVMKMVSKGVRFDLVFIDPPYNDGLYEKALRTVFESKILEQDGIVAVEHPSDIDIGEANDLYRLSNRRKYGNTTISFYKGEKL